MYKLIEYIALFLIYISKPYAVSKIPEAIFSSHMSHQVKPYLHFTISSISSEPEVEKLEILRFSN